MKKKLTSLTKMILIVLGLGTAALLSLSVGAGSLEPANSPAPTMHTLGEVYNKIKQLVPENWASMPSHSQVAGAWAAHMDVIGANQGLIQGSCEAQGKEGTIVVVGNEHKIYVPIDTSGCYAAGPRKHSPFTILKYVDKASPKFYQAMCTGEHLATVTIRFYRTGSTGQEEQYWTVRLQDALITEISTITPNLESVSFLYEKIRWSWNPDSIEFEDRPCGMPQ